MPKPKGKYKGKSNKIDVIEDYIGSEELSGTYEGRALNWKRIKREKMLREDMEIKYLEKLRKAKEDKIRSQLVTIEQYADINDKITFLLIHLLEPEAYGYINLLRQAEPEVCKQMMKYLFQPNDIQNIDVYVEAIAKAGHGPKKRIKFTTIMKIYRKVKGIKGKITMVDKKGESFDVKELFGARKVA